MKTVYYIGAEHPCPECQGTGVVQHPAWSDYWAEHHGQSLPTAEDDLRWFSDHGWDDIPPEETRCDECAGAGILRQRVPLTEVFGVALQDAIAERDKHIYRLELAIRTLAARVGQEAWAEVRAIILGGDDE